MAVKFNWDFWTTQEQPTDFIDELIASLNAAATMDRAEPTMEQWLQQTRIKHQSMIKRYIA